jgi:hypothetical protein
MSKATPAPKTIHLVAVSAIPLGGRSVDDWIPFRGSGTLGALVAMLNRLWEQRYRELKWLPEDVEDLRQVLAIAPFHVGNIREYDPRATPGKKILLLDLAALAENATSKEGLDAVRARLQRARASFYLSQVSAKPNLPSRIADFNYLKAFTTQPEILSSHEMLTNYLDRFSRLTMLILDSFSPPSTGGGGGPGVLRFRYGSTPPSTRRPADEWRRVATFAVRLRDLALEQGLTQPQTRLVATTVARSNLLRESGSGTAAMNVAKGLCASIRRGKLPISPMGRYLGSLPEQDTIISFHVPVVEKPQKTPGGYGRVRVSEKEDLTTIFRDTFCVRVPVAGRSVPAADGRSRRVFKLGTYPQKQRKYVELQFPSEPTAIVHRGAAHYATASVLARYV